MAHTQNGPHRNGCITRTDVPDGAGSGSRNPARRPLPRAPLGVERSRAGPDPRRMSGPPRATAGRSSVARIAGPPRCRCHRSSPRCTAGCPARPPGRPAAEPRPPRLSGKPRDARPRPAAPPQWVRSATTPLPRRHPRSRRQDQEARRSRYMPSRRAGRRGSGRHRCSGAHPAPTGCLRTSSTPEPGIADDPDATTLSPPRRSGNQGPGLNERSIRHRRDRAGGRGDRPSSRCGSVRTGLLDREEPRL
jgi:hypothetical protein